MVSEESLLVMLRKMPFPDLEVIKIDNRYLRTTVARLKSHCRLPKLKKLNLKKCAVKLDAETLKVCQNKLTESQMLESKAALHAKRSLKMKSKNLEKTKKFLSQEESSDAEYEQQKGVFESSVRQLSWRHNMKIDRAPGRREFCDSDRESDLSDELQIVTKRHNRKLKFHKLKT